MKTIKSAIYYNQWRDIRQRCFNPHNHSYSLYKDLDYNLDDYWEFEDHIIRELGHRPTPRHLLTRRDHSQGWVYGNLCWKTRLDVSRRQRSCVLVKYQRRIFNISELAEHLGIGYHRFKNLLHRYNGNIKKVINATNR